MYKCTGREEEVTDREDRETDSEDGNLTGGWRDAQVGVGKHTWRGVGREAP